MYLTPDAVFGTLWAITALAPGTEIIFQYTVPKELCDRRASGYADPQQKCKATRPTRKSIAAKHPGLLPTGGLTLAEVARDQRQAAAKARFDALSPVERAVREAAFERGRKALENRRGKASMKRCFPYAGNDDLKNREPWFARNAAARFARPGSGSIPGGRLVRKWNSLTETGGRIALDSHFLILLSVYHKG